MAMMVRIYDKKTTEMKNEYKKLRLQVS